MHRFKRIALFLLVIVAATTFTVPPVYALPLGGGGYYCPPYYTEGSYPNCRECRLTGEWEGMFTGTIYCQYECEPVYCRLA
jgi:hypothetical protein